LEASPQENCGLHYTGLANERGCSTPITLCSLAGLDTRLAQIVPAEGELRGSSLYLTVAVQAG